MRTRFATLTAVMLVALAVFAAPASAGLSIVNNATPSVSRMAAPAAASYTGLE